jgi:hypothetical protein
LTTNERYRSGKLMSLQLEMENQVEKGTKKKIDD